MRQLLFIYLFIHFDFLEFECKLEFGGVGFFDATVQTPKMEPRLRSDLDRFSPFSCQSYLGEVWTF